MARREEQDDDIIRDEDTCAYAPHLTWGEFYRLPDREKWRIFQTLTQIPATKLGYWKTCTLSICRRARTCRGFLTEAQYREGGYHTGFPPCLGKGAPRHGEIMRMIGELARQSIERRNRQRQGKA